MMTQPRCVRRRQTNPEVQPLTMKYLDALRLSIRIQFSPRMGLVTAGDGDRTRDFNLGKVALHSGPGRPAVPEREVEKDVRKDVSGRSRWGPKRLLGGNPNTHENVKRHGSGDWFILSLDAVDPLEKSGVRGCELHRGSGLWPNQDAPLVVAAVSPRMRRAATSTR
jgi:hypothetical protein